MSFWGKMFSSAEVVDKTIDAVVATGDKIWYTEEEKAEGRQKMLDWVLKYHEASKGSNLARRFLALMIVGVFLFLILVCAALILANDSAKFDEMYKLIKDTLTVPVGVIVTFYFTSGMVRDWASKK